MAYRIEYKPSAEREFLALPKNVQRLVRPRIDALARDPRPPGSKKLRGYVNRWRIRVGDYRVIYEVYDKDLLVLIVKIGHRSDVYE